MAGQPKAAKEPQKPTEGLTEDSLAPVTEPVRQPVYLADNRNRLDGDRVAEVRAEEGIAPQHRLIEHTAAGVIKGS